MRANKAYGGRQKGVKKRKKKAVSKGAEKSICSPGPLCAPGTPILTVTWTYLLSHIATFRKRGTRRKWLDFT